MKLIFADTSKGHAFFFTQSKHVTTGSDNRFLDYVHLIKITVEKEGKISAEHMDVPLPEQQVNTKVICTYGNETIYCYCFCQN